MSSCEACSFRNELALSIPAPREIVCMRDNVILALDHSPEGIENIS